MDLQIKNLSKSFRKNVILDNISFTLDEGKCVGLIGRNGEGKTTFIKCICNLLKQDSGQILINDVDQSKNKRNTLYKLGVLLEGASNLYNFLTVDYNLNYFGYLNKLSLDEIKKRKDYLLDLFCLRKYQYKTVNELSRGTQQKIALIVILMKDPELLILDEPTLGMDIISTYQMMETLKLLKLKEKKSFIIISHDLSLIKYLCDEVYCLKNHKLFNLYSEKNLSDDYLFNFNVAFNNENENILKSNKIEYAIDNDVIKFESSQINSIINLFDAKDILSVEKKNEDIENYVKKIFGE